MTVLVAMGLAGSMASPAHAADGVATVRTAGTVLNVRTGPGTSYATVGTVAPGAGLTVACQVAGERISGATGTTAQWDLLASGGYVSHAYISGGPAAAACPSAAPQDGPAYIAAVAPLARTWARSSGIPASVTIAQAILESGWGRSALSRDGNSQFGIKCFGGPGAVAVGCRSYHSSECVNGKCFPTTASFRMYRTMADSFQDHDRFLRLNSRYALALQARGNPDLFAVRLQQAGYATDPGYAAKLTGIIHGYHLEQFDQR
jgi:hypothetical protein